MQPHIALLYYILRAAGWLPLRWLHALGAGMGSWMARGDGRLSRHTATNLRLVRPQLDDAARSGLKREVLRQTGRSVTELAAIWGRSPALALSLVREVRGEALFSAALADPRGLIIAAPHLGCWELLNYWLCSRTEMAILYRPPRQTGLEALLRRARGALGPEQVRADGAGVRILFKRLRGGGTIGVLPDQEPRRGEGEFAPFYGVDALTMVLLPRLAQRSGAQVLFSYAERLPRGQGFRIHFLAAPKDIASADTHAACCALNAGVQGCADQAFTQYQWHYKRFRERPNGAASPYSAKH